MKMKKMYNDLKNITPVILVSVLVLLGAVTVVNAQGQDSGGKSSLDDKDALLHETQIYASNNNVSIGEAFDAQVYASNNNVSTEEALRRLQLQNIPMPEEELRTKEVETFAGLWVEHTPEFKIVVQFTRDGEETIKPYLEQYPEFADIVEVRNTAKVSLADLQRAQANASDSARALGVPVNSGINVYENRVELYVAKTDRSRFDDALQKREIRLPDSVRVITVEALAEDLGASSSPRAQAIPEAPGFELFSGIIALMLVLRKKKEKIKA